ncbi:hypothetical protein GGI07_005852 [Coemansia sp. Benny D115]|nr:hypothetical protein GGI07_005852 [Coemansia sp. Benny D115]
MTSRLDTITSRMSKLMLKRWTMLAELCPIDGCSAPLMREPGTEVSKCVWHNASEIFPEESPKDEKLDNDATPEQPVYDLEPDLVIQDTPESRKRKEKREQGERASELIAKKLLQGWAMIDESCPNESCYNVPLIKDREGFQLCVICGQKYMDENTYARKYGTTGEPQVESQRKSEDQTKIGGKVCNKEVAVGQNASATTPDVPVAPVSDSVAEPRTTTDPFGPPYLAICPPKPEYSMPGNAQETAIDALNNKLVQLSAALSNASDYSEIKRITKAMTSCAKALRECKKLL